MKAKLEFILQMVSEIEEYQKSFPILADLLKNRMAFNATLMNLLQIRETLNKIDADFLSSHGLWEDAQGAYATRNFIAHDYEGVNKAVIEDIVKNHLPLLKSKILPLLA